MGKKSEKPVTEPAKTVTKAKPAAKAAPAIVVAPLKEKKPAAKTVAKTKEAPKAKPVTPKLAAPTFEEIQKQAYFVAQRRMAKGLPGDAASDWIQAEKELLGAKK